MTPVEIAYFKHFLFDKMLNRSYTHYYKMYPVLGSPKGDKDGNPASIEQFFLQTTVKDVVMKAFMFRPCNKLESRSNFSFDYWKDIDDKWQEYMKSNACNFSNEAWPQLIKTFAILRQNWDVPQYWKTENLESTEEVYRRMHIDLPLPETIWAHGSKDRVYSDKESESTQESVVEEQEPILEFTETVDDNPFAAFDFLDEDFSNRSYKLSSNEISINFNNSYKITFNIFVSRFVKKQGYRFARLAKSPDGDVCIILNNLKGANLSNISENNSHQNITINSKDICSKIRSIFHIKPDYSLLNIYKVQSSLDYCIYKITKP